jgi:lysophospholipase L1-like esterase
MLRSDGVHPNEQGDAFIAKQVGPVLIQAIKTVRGGTRNATLTAV